ncbi:hypothetical protein [Microvirga massiliensis]|uniref:hypothetical protein n=1 Tax=Microvirga massiliensis TaxID=1033741 RepID=UPI00062B466D|nr:hypothetical protein [Microvirga massiliensis]
MAEKLQLVCDRCGEESELFDSKDDSARPWDRFHQVSIDTSDLPNHAPLYGFDPHGCQVYLLCGGCVADVLGTFRVALRRTAHA